ncbi:MAG: VWA domain-containing protein [Acidobacteriaceae bacterium]|nr:VWA domain-containing protein [Acidobacteriaceae bacterium]MBV9498436.1 VWA domain-containing protein [Acidobacteriaceae bacterium]
MFFLNLTAAEFFVLLGTLASLITALYLLDRAKRRKVVSTLRFWSQAMHAEERQSRKRMRDPWSLVLQLASLLLLVLAIAQLQWGSREHRGSDHVLVLDTSSWTAAGTGQGAVLDREKLLARRYLATLPARDRVMVLRADALTTPVTPFTEDRPKLHQAIDQSASAFSALNIERALEFASLVQRSSGGGPGEIVYIGPEMVDSTSARVPNLANLRVVPVEINRDNCGIRRLVVHHSDEDRNAWMASVTVKNYAAAPRTIRLEVRFAGTAFAPRVLRLAPAEEREVEYAFVTNTAGALIAQVRPDDDLEADNRAELWLPRNETLRIVAFTDRPELLSPLFAANHRLDLTFAPVSAYTPKPAADLVILDQFSPSEPPRIPSLWIAPTEDHSPSPVKSVVADATIDRWSPGTLLSGDRYAKDFHLARAEVFETFPGDLTIGSVAQGPVVLARPDSGLRKRLALVGFDPLSESVRFQITTPLLFADLLRWLSPEVFRIVDATADHVGILNVSLNEGERPDQLRVTGDKGAAVPFTLNGRALQVFTTRPQQIHIASNDRDRIFSLTLPEVAEYSWTAPPASASGLPAPARLSPSAIDLWRWLAILGGVGLLLEWLLYGRHRRQAPRPRRPPEAYAPSSDRARELVAK